MVGRFYSVRSLLIVAALLPASILTANESIELVTGEWPPFIYPEGDGQGLITEVVQEAFSQIGVSTSVAVLPWNRVKRVVNTEQAISYGWSWSPERSTSWHYSEEIVRTTDVFAERRSAPVEWNSVEDLTPWRIGVVESYNLPVNIEQIRNQLTTIPAPSDETNLRMLLAGRTDIAIINPRVAQYLLETQFTEQERDRVVIRAAKPIIGYTLHLVCHMATPGCAETILNFNEGLRRLHFDGKSGQRADASWRPTMQ